MSSHTSPTCSDFSIAVFAKKIDFKNTVIEIINATKGGGLRTNGTLKTLHTPDIFDEQCSCPDQQIIDFLSLSLPGPNLFILAIDSENCQLEEVVDQILKLQSTVGEKVAAQLAVVTETMSIYTSLFLIKETFESIHIANISEDLAIKCHKWCSDPFQYDYKNYSADVVKRRKEQLDQRHDWTPSCHCWEARNNPACSSASQNTPPENNTAVNDSEAPDDCFNIVLLGQTGAGKTASANTILTAGNSNIKSKNILRSEPSSMPITTQCDPIIVEQFGKQIRVVDTPDFFNNQIESSQKQIEECKKYCQQGRCIVLLVIQLGRITDGERDILEKLEETLGWKIRESTIILLTHGEDFKDDLEKYINKTWSLKKMVEACGNRYHLFKNTSNDEKQVMKLIKKFPNYEQIFPKLKGNKKECCLC